MSHPQIQYFKSKLYAGLIFLLFSLGILFILVPLSILKNHVTVLESSILSEKYRALQREYDRLSEESGRKNSEIVSINERMNALVTESSAINGHINHLMQGNPSEEKLDSVRTLYEEKVLVLEPTIDSLRQIFGEKTEDMLNFLGRIYEKEKDLNISKYRHEFKQQISSLYFYGGIILLVISLIMGFAGFFMLRSGLKGLKTLPVQSMELEV